MNVQIPADETRLLRALVRLVIDGIPTAPPPSTNAIRCENGVPEQVLMGLLELDRPALQKMIANLRLRGMVSVSQPDVWPLRDDALTISREGKPKLTIAHRRETRSAFLKRWPNVKRQLADGRRNACATVGHSIEFIREWPAETKRQPDVDIRWVEHSVGNVYMITPAGITLLDEFDRQPPPLDRVSFGLTSAPLKDEPSRDADLLKLLHALRQLEFEGAKLMAGAPNRVVMRFGRGVPSRMLRNWLDLQPDAYRKLLEMAKRMAYVEESPCDLVAELTPAIVFAAGPAEQRRIFERADGKQVLIEWSPLADGTLFINSAVGKLREDGRFECNAMMPTFAANGRDSRVRITADGLKYLQNGRGHAAPSNGDVNDGEFHSAAWFEIRHGIRASRLTEAAGNQLIRTKAAPKGYADVEGRRAFRLYHVEDALKHCSPKRR